MTIRETNRNVRVAALIALGAVSALPLACGGSKPPDSQANAAASANFGNQPPPPGATVPPGQTAPGTQPPPPGQTAAPGTQPPPGGTAPAASSSAPPPGPLGTVNTTDPNALAQLFAQAAAAGGALLQQPGAIAGDPVEAGIKASAAKNAPGMSPEGQIAKGNLTEGQHLTFLIPMIAGKCYTIVGFATPGGVKNLDLNLLAPPFYNVLSGQDTTDDNAPVVGKGNNPLCPITPIALQYKVDIVARKGAGAAGVQVFSKNK